MASDEKREFALFSGCLIANRYPILETLTFSILNKLNIKVRYIDGFTCCPDPFSFGIFREKLWYVLAARNISIAEEKNVDILTLCSGCNITLLTVNEVLRRNDEMKDYINTELKKIGRQVRGTIDVKSILRVLYDDVGLAKLKTLVKKRLSGMNVAVHYGCHILRELKYFDDPRNPSSLESLVRLTGAKVVDYRKQRLCCGSLAKFYDSNLSLEFLKEKVEAMKRSGADLIVVICPYCYNQFKLGQVLLKRKFNMDFNLPVLHLVELLARAFDVKHS